jgi:N-acetylmuramoyl-L-alanine amidase
VRDVVVIIDPGHGGDDPGAVGPTGLEEKEVALALALALARELSENPEIEVRLTRDRDTEVPLWARGEWATEWKGNRRGVFVSIHANALPDRSGVRGFETYFLSEARTEHERRVVAAENAPLSDEADLALAGADPLLDNILTDLRVLEYQQGSARLAESVQRALSEFHPGPDRGVKQGPFAVITNALMPGILVEIGFITNPEEERLLSRDEFHRDAARAMVRALEVFLRPDVPGGAG